LRISRGGRAPIRQLLLQSVRVGGMESRRNPAHLCTGKKASGKTFPMKALKALPLAEKTTEFLIQNRAPQGLRQGGLQTLGDPFPGSHEFGFPGGDGQGLRRDRRLTGESLLYEPQALGPLRLERGGLPGIPAFQRLEVVKKISGFGITALRAVDEAPHHPAGLRKTLDINAVPIPRARSLKGNGLRGTGKKEVFQRWSSVHSFRCACS